MSPTRAKPGIVGFDGLRAVAALAVLSYHVALVSGVTRGGWFAPVGWELKGGVGIFFPRASREGEGVRIRVIDSLTRRPGRWVLLAVAAFAVALPSQRADTFLPWYRLMTHLAIGAGSGLLVLSVIVPQRTGVGRRRRILSHPVLAWIGTISYGIHLWHLPVLALIAPHLLPAASRGSLDVAALTWLVVVAGAVACGAASWYLV